MLVLPLLLSVESLEWKYLVRVTEYDPGYAPILNRAPEDCDPGCNPEVEYEVLRIVNVDGVYSDLISEDELTELVFQEVEERRQ